MTQFSGNAAPGFTEHKSPEDSASEVAGDERLHYDSSDDYVL